MSLFVQETIGSIGLVVFIVSFAFLSFGIEPLLYGPLP